MELNAIIFFLYAAILITASVTDIRYLYVPDCIHLGILALSVCSYVHSPIPGLPNRILASLAAGGLLLLVSVLTRGGIGGGDIKLATSCGLLLGFEKTFLALLLSYLLAGLIHLPLLLSGKTDKKAEIPMVPYFTAAFLLSAAYGNRLIHWYLHLFVKVP